MPVPVQQILDDVLVVQAQSGQRHAIERLIERYQPPLRYFLTKLLGRGEAVEDVLQEVWLAVLSQLPRLKASEAFSVWIYRIARNRAYDLMRRSRSLAALPEEIPDPVSEEDFSAEEAAAVHHALDLLSYDHREVLLLRYLEQMNYDEIAAVTGCPVGTVKSRIHHAKLLLRREMERAHAEK